MGNRGGNGHGNGNGNGNGKDHKRRDLLVVVGLLLPVLVLGGGGLLASVLVADVADAYRAEIVDRGKEPAFLLTLAFLLTFGVVRLVTSSIRSGRRSPFRNVTLRGGLHVHHMVPGTILVLLAGFLAVVLPDPRPDRALAIAFGIGAALVLDEFALLLRLADVYWQPEGRESIDAVVLAGGLAILYVLGFSFWPRLLRALAAPFLGP